MPKTKFQNVIFTLMMAFLMVYAMICYNISLNIGGMSNQVFLMAFGEMKIMWPAALSWNFSLLTALLIGLPSVLSHPRTDHLPSQPQFPL